MKKLLWITLFVPYLAMAADDNSAPLRVAVSSFNAPFVMQSSYNQFYGFDIAMMDYVCKALNRSCQYIAMNMNDILPAISNRDVDLAVSAIVITPDHAKLVQFSVPYMLSEGQFLSTQTLAKQTFDLQLLNNKKIGVVQGTVYGNQINLMGIKNARIIQYQSIDQMIAALKAGTIDLGFLDSHTARYWQDNSSGSLHTFGNTFPVGYGLGVVANRMDSGLIQDVNIALLRYQDSADFKTNFNLYLDSF